MQSTEPALNNYLIEVNARPLMMTIVEKALRDKPANVIAYFVEALHERDA